MTSDLNFPTPANEIISTRIVNASKETVFRAWSDPTHLANWWGPAGFTNTFEIFEFREGGTWKFMMHGPDKGNYPNEVVFTKIDPPNQIAWTRITQPHFNVVFTFEPLVDNKTKIVFKMIFETEEECNKLKKFVVGKNEENFDKLENELLKINI